jgi:hypothetical protein
VIRTKLMLKMKARRKLNFQRPNVYYSQLMKIVWKTVAVRGQKNLQQQEHVAELPALVVLVAAVLSPQTNKNFINQKK